MKNNLEIRHFNYIDALRGIAVLLVLVVHAAQAVKPGPGLFSFLFFKGAYGVELFFIVSSLTIFLSYEQRIKVDGKNADKFFFLRRFFRIAPLFYFAILFYSLTIPVQNYLLLRHHIAAVSFGNYDLLMILIFTLFLGLFYPPSMTLMPFGGWTVQVEALMYVFMPFLFRKISSLKRAIIFLLCTWGFYQLLLLYFNKPDPFEAYPYTLFPSMVPVFAIGIVCYHILKNDRLKEKIKPYLLLCLSLLFLAVTFYLCHKYPVLPEHLLVSVAFAGIVLAMSRKQIILLENRVTEFFGKISYSLYLWHFIFIKIAWYFYYTSARFRSIGMIPDFIIILFVHGAISSLVAYASYKYIEKPGIALGKKIITRLEEKGKIPSINQEVRVF